MEKIIIKREHFVLKKDRYDAGFYFSDLPIDISPTDEIDIIRNISEDYSLIYVFRKRLETDEELNERIKLIERQEKAGKLVAKVRFEESKKYYLENKHLYGE